jgi:hypothetical protein
MLVFVLLTGACLLVPTTTTSTNNNRCLSVFFRVFHKFHTFTEKTLETLAETSRLYRILLSRPRQLALTYCSLPISTHISERKCSTLLYS